MPILLIIVFGIIQYGFYFWAMQGGSDIARDAARMAAVGEPAHCTGVVDGQEGFVDKIKDEVDKLPGTSSVIVKRTYASSTSPDPTPDEVQVNDEVTVTVSFNSIDLHIPLVPHIKDGKVSSTAQARVEYVPDPDELGDCT